MLILLSPQTNKTNDLTGKSSHFTTLYVWFYEIIRTPKASLSYLDSSLPYVPQCIQFSICFISKYISNVEADSCLISFYDQMLNLHLHVSS